MKYNKSISITYEVFVSAETKKDIDTIVSKTLMKIPKESIECFGDIKNPIVSVTRLKKTRIKNCGSYKIS